MFPAIPSPCNKHRHDIVVLTLVRSLRVVRVIRLATHIRGFDQVLAACTYPARVLLNVFVLLAIGVYVFANIGVALFSDVELEVPAHLSKPELALLTLRAAVYHHV